MASVEEKYASSPPPIYIVSGGVGASGEQLAHTVLAQYPESELPVITIGNVRQIEQIEEVIGRAQETGGLILHTLVEAHLREALIKLAGETGVEAIDLMGPLFSWITGASGSEPVGSPGLYRKLRKDYFDRVTAIEYTMAHDDGKDPEGWGQAEIVLTGVSRTGKTPLSLYLSVLGWKVANVPLVPSMPFPSKLFQLDKRRVVALTIEPGQLLLHRKQRQSRLGVSGPSDYVEPEKVFEEVQTSLQLFRQSGFAVVDVTDKPIETSADEIIRVITRRTRSGIADEEQAVY